MDDENALWAEFLRKLKSLALRAGLSPGTSPSRMKKTAAASEAIPPPIK
jgi:hypothetical protein